MDVDGCVGPPRGHDVAASLRSFGAVGQLRVGGGTMLCLHYYSNCVTLRLTGRGGGDDDDDDHELYRIDQIQEFADVEQRWLELLAHHQASGSGVAPPGRSFCRLGLFAVLFRFICVRNDWNSKVNDAARPSGTRLMSRIVTMMTSLPLMGSVQSAAEYLRRQFRSRHTRRGAD